MTTKEDGNAKNEMCVCVCVCVYARLKVLAPLFPLRWTHRGMNCRCCKGPSACCLTTALSFSC